MKLFIALILAVLYLCAGPAVDAAAPKHATPETVVLSNDWIVAEFQLGLLVRLKDRVTGATLVDYPLDTIKSGWALFGGEAVDLTEYVVTPTRSGDAASWRWQAGNKAAATLRWSIEPGHGDLVLHASAKAASPTREMRVPIYGCRIVDHDLVVVAQFGAGNSFRAPWNDHFIGDPATSAISETYVHPLVALFQGAESGWLIEGRSVELAPANLMAAGRGDTADLALVRGFYPPTQNPELFEIRIRVYHGDWSKALEPYADWLEQEVGFVPLDQQEPAWVREVNCQAHLRACDFEGLELLAGVVDPTRTMIGRVTNYRNSSIYFHWPDYSMPDESIRWFRRARELGFHLVANVSAEAIFNEYTDLIERFRGGLIVAATDADGNESYVTSSGPNIYCSTAHKPWRAYLIEQIRPLVEAGADAIHLDEGGIPGSSLYVNGENAVEGASDLVREIKEAYPGVAVQAELNIKNLRHAAFAQIDYYSNLGHPLAGALFSRFVKFAGAGKYAAPIDEATMDFDQSWGYLLPAAGRETSWNQISAAFQRYELMPDPGLELSDGQLFGYRGANGVAAYFQKEPGRRGLAIHEPGNPVRWTGSRVAGLTRWPGPGVVKKWFSGPAIPADWLIYDGDTLLGLDPAASYFLEEEGRTNPDQFHLTRIPNDFAFYYDDKYRTIGQEAGVDDSYYRLLFTGNGLMEIFLPDGWVGFLDGKKLQVDQSTSKVEIVIATPPDKPSDLLVFGRSDTVLAGRWVDLPWQISPMHRQWYVGRRTTLSHSSDGPVRLPTDSGDMHTHVTGRGVIIGRLPDANSIRIHGAYRMSDRVPNGYGDGVIRINGREVLRIPIEPPGETPRKVHPIDVDISKFAGQHVLLEFISDGKVAGLGEEAFWYAPQIRVVE